MESDIYRQFYEFEKDHWWSKGMRHLCRSMIERYAGSGKEALVLDIGCGTGELTRSLGRYGTAWGADLSGEAIDFCKKRGIKRLVRTSAESAGFKDATFSVVVAFCLIEHIEEDELFLKEMRRILKPGGHLVLLTSAYRFLWSYHDDIAHHKRRYTVAGIRALMARSGLQVKKASYVNSFLFPPIAAVRILQRLFNFRPKETDAFVLDVVKTPGFLQRFFCGILMAESELLRHIDLPFGVGIISVGARR